MHDATNSNPNASAPLDIIRRAFHELKGNPPEFMPDTFWGWFYSGWGCGQRWQAARPVTDHVADASKMVTTPEPEPTPTFKVGDRVIGKTEAYWHRDTGVVECVDVGRIRVQWPIGLSNEHPSDLMLAPESEPAGIGTKGPIG